MFKRFYPDYTAKAAVELEPQKLFDDGIRGVILDIDNTLAKYGEDKPSDATKLWLESLLAVGIKVCLISNNTQRRVDIFRDGLDGIAGIGKAGKPKRSAYAAACAHMGVGLCEETEKTLLAVGDQLFTDVWGAHRAHMLAVYVPPLGPDPYFYITWKRALEKIVFKFYKRSLNRRKNADASAEKSKKHL